MRSRKPLVTGPLAAAVLLCAATFAANVPKLTSESDPAALMDAGHFKRARPLVEARAQSRPNDAETLYLQARIKAAFGDQEDAIKLAERALALNDKVVVYHGAVAHLYAERAQNGAGMLEQFTLARKVKQHLEQALALDPRDWRTLDGFVQFYLVAPGLMGGDKGRAQAVADQTVKWDALHGWLMQARVAQEFRNNVRIEQSYLNALQADPNDYSALVGISTFYLQDDVKKYDLADKYAREAIHADPGRAPGYALLGASLIYRGRYGNVLDTWLAQAEKNVPDDLTPYFVAGRTLVVAGQDFPDAERYLRKYLAQEPEGNAPKHAQAHWRLGQLYQKSGRAEQARVEYRDALRLAPSFEPAKKGLRSLP